MSRPLQRIFRRATRLLSSEASSTVRVNALKRNLAAGAPQIGFWTGLRSPVIAECVSHSSGFDWFVIDMEHSPNELGDVLAQLQASQHGHAEPVVRVPWNEPVVVKRVLDIGAQSLLFPYIQTAEEAASAVASTRYPPHGGRGAMSVGRMNGYGTQMPHYYRDAAAQLCCIMQIETAAAIEHIPEISAVEGVDALFIGPADLAASLGHVGDPSHPDVRAAIGRAVQLICASGKPAGFLSANPSDCHWALGEGARLVAVGSDIALVANSTRKLADDFKAFCAKLRPPLPPIGKV